MGCWVINVQLTFCKNVKRKREHPQRLSSFYYAGKISRALIVEKLAIASKKTLNNTGISIKILNNYLNMSDIKYVTLIMNANNECMAISDKRS